MALIVAFTMLATGCGNSSNTTDSKDNKDNSTQVQTEASTSGESGDSAIDTSKEVKLKMVLVSDKPKDTDLVYAEVNKLLKEKINATVEPVFLAWSDYQTKYPLMFASGEEFDLAYAANWCFYNQIATKGGYLELTEDLIKTYAPITYSKVTEDQWLQTKIQGKIYMVPYTALELRKTVVTIRGDLRKKYGLPELQTTEDLTKYWDAVLANDPGLQPISLNDRNTDWLMNMFTTGTGTWRKTGDTGCLPYYNVEDNTTIDWREPYNNPVYLENAKLMKQFQQKGYWAKNTLANKSLTYDDFMNGKSASMIQLFLDTCNYYVQLNNAHPDWEVEVYDVRPDIKAIANPVTNNGMTIHATSKNVERALMMLDLFRYDRELFDLTTYGIKGKHWMPVGENGYEQIAQDGFKVDDACPWGWRTELYRELGGISQQVRDLTENYKKNYITNRLQMFNFDETSVKTEMAAMNAVISKYAPILEYGFAEDVEATYKEFNEQMTKAGKDKVYAEWLRQAEEFVESYGK